MSYKNFQFRLIGYALLLFVGARTQSAKAVYPDPNVVEAHWRKNPRIFQETFEALFQKAEQLSLWSEEFPDWFKEQNGSLYATETTSGYVPFHTASDLDQLSCDVELKKIIKVLSSSKFLESVLTEAVVKSIYAHAIGGEEFKLKIEFFPCFNDGFFNVLGEGSLGMNIGLEYSGGEVLACQFTFDFEKRTASAVLKNCQTFYGVPHDDIPGLMRYSRMEFLKKTEKFSRFPRNAVAEAKKKIPLVYARLRDYFRRNPEEYKGRKNYKGGENGKARLERQPSSASVIEKYGDTISAMLDILITEDFLKGIFGEEFADVLEHGASGKVAGGVLMTNFRISECNDGVKSCIVFENPLRGNMMEDVVWFENHKNYPPQKWDWIDLNYINFVFFYDPRKDEISHVKLQDKIILNYELILKGEAEDVLPPVDDDDFFEPDTFEEVLKKGGVNP